MAKKNSKLNTSQLRLLDLVKTGLHGGFAKKYSFSEQEWREIVELAGVTRTAPFVYLAIKDSEDCPDLIKNLLSADTDQIVKKNYRLWMLTLFLTNKLEEAGVKCVVLKGPAAGKYYAVPEMRKSGDVDLLVSPDDMDKACKVLESLGCVYTEERPHHKSFEIDGGIEVELHRTVSKDFLNEEVNEAILGYVCDGLNKIERATIEGDLAFPCFDSQTNGLSLLLHMLQHFIVGGFGIKLLCDWMMYLEGTDILSLRALKEKIDGMRLATFTSATTYICSKSLGLSAEKAAVFETEEIPDKTIENLMYDIFETGEFGDHSSDRMVLLSNKSLKGLLLQLHYQMKINHPVASKYPILWPALWIVTAIVFVANNRRVRHVSTASVIKSALERSEGANMDNLKVFVK